MFLKQFDFIEVKWKENTEQRFSETSKLTCLAKTQLQEWHYKAYDAIIIICMMDLLCNFYFILILLDNKLPEGWTNIPNWYNCIMKMYLMTYNLDLITLWMYLGLGWIIQIEKMCKSSTILTEQNGQFLQWGHRTNRTCIRLYGMLVCKTWEVWLGEVFTKYPNCDCSGVVSMSTSSTHTPVNFPSLEQYHCTQVVSGHQ